MKKNIIITGRPKSGKSTLLRKLITDIPDKVGFVTNEILGDTGRIGFEIETYSGEKTLLAHVDFETPYKVSRYFVKIQNLESILPKVSHVTPENFLYLDEIGQMQLFSEKFKKLVSQYLDSPNTSLLTLSYIYEDDFTKRLKERDDIILIEITEDNRQEKEEFIVQLLKKIGKAKKYIKEKNRFTLQDEHITLQGEHAMRKLVCTQGVWQCDCEFYKQYDICSHVIATPEIIKNK